MGAARHDFAIALDRDFLPGQLHCVEQVSDFERAGVSLFSAIYHDLNASEHEGIIQCSQ